MRAKHQNRDNVIFAFLIVLSVLTLAPILIVLMNSFKGRFSISDAPFELPTGDTFSGIDNYITGIEKTGFIQAFGYSLFITVFSVAVIVLFTAMTAWYITRVKSKATSGLYYLFLFSMIVPFDMVMFTMSKMANMLHLDNPIGIILIYLGFGSGLSVFMFSGFVKSIPLDIEEAATIDGCNPIQTFFRIVFPILKPVSFTVAILNAMWVWNDYRLPYLLMGSNYRTIPMAVQYLRGHDGDARAGNAAGYYFLYGLPKIHH
jgi:raffinose/stachyose/melibiose transport system permease protein